MKRYILTFEEIERFNNRLEVTKDISIIWLDLQNELVILKRNNFSISHFFIKINKRYSYLSSKRSKVMCFGLKQENKVLDEILEKFDYIIVGIEKEKDKSKFFKLLNHS